MDQQPEIFVSYSWKGESEALVDQLCAAFRQRGYTITRDKSAMTYKDSIKQFMDRIGRGRYIIAIVNDKYMKSEYCMYEAYRMFQSPEFRARVFPIVLPDADVFSFRGQAAYLKHWIGAYDELQAEYKALANAAPTMVAPLAERLRDIEATTRFINDFMAAVGDMNVLTSEMHQESNFQQLIAAIEARIQTSDSALPESNASTPSKENVMSEKNIHTGGGAYIGGSVNTGGGDFVGHDKITKAEKGGVAIGGNAIVTGSHNVVGSQVSQRQESIQHIYTIIEKRPDTTALDKEDLKANVEEIQAEDDKGDEANESFIARRLRNIQRMAPDILEVILATIANPIAGFGVVAKKIAEKMKAEAGG